MKGTGPRLSNLLPSGFRHREADAICEPSPEKVRKGIRGTDVLSHAMKLMLPRTLLPAFASLLLALPALAQREMETLDRGLVAVRQAEGKVYLGWRLFGTDPEG